jgi:hypothetical protein
MKVEYIENGSNDCPLIRIYGEESFDDLIKSFRGLSNGETDNVVLNELPGYESINGCHLILKAGTLDEGIKKTSDSIANFTWVMTRSSWDDLAALAEPFYEFSGYHYQWLAGREVRMANLSMSDIALVISTYPDGQW